MNPCHRFSCIIITILAACLSACSSQPFDPEREIRIYYEKPMGCDEVSGTITLKASVRGEGAPVPAKIHYMIWTDNESKSLIFEGNAPDYEALFDTTTIRDGFARIRAIPLDNAGKEINIKAAPYNARGFIPSFKGFMIRNQSIDVSRPVIIMGAPIEPNTGDLSADTLPEQLTDHLVFSASLMTHLQHLGFIPDFCFTDETTIVFDPDNPSSDFADWPQNPVDLLGQPVTTRVRWNPGTLCYTSPFFEAPKANGLPDIWELTAFDNVLFYHAFGPVDSQLQAVSFFQEVIDVLSPDHTFLWDWFSMFGFEKPVPYGEPEDLLEKKLEQKILEGATAVLIYDFYYKANEFEMSSGSWPRFQEALDKANAKLGTSVKLGAITTNSSQIMQYEEFYQALFVAIRYLVQSVNPPPDATIGIILAAHGSSTTNRLYDVSNIIHNPLMKQRIEEYFGARRQDVHQSGPPCVVCYSEYANKESDGLPGVGEQVRRWVDDHYKYVFIFPLEWPWPTRDVWLELRKNAVEHISLDAQAKEHLYRRDARNRSIIKTGDTVVVFGETIFDQRQENPEAYQLVKTAAQKLLRDRMAELVQK